MKLKIWNVQRFLRCYNCKVSSKHAKDMLRYANNITSLIKVNDLILPSDITYEFVELFVIKCFGYWCSQQSPIPFPLYDILTIIKYNKRGERWFYCALLEHVPLHEKIHPEAFLYIEKAVDICHIPSRIYKAASDNFYGFIHGNLVTSSLWMMICTYKSADALILACMSWNGEEWFKDQFYRILQKCNIATISCLHDILRMIDSVGIPLKVYLGILHDQTCLYGPNTQIGYWLFVDQIRSLMITNENRSDDSIVKLINRLIENLDFAPCECHGYIARSILELSMISELSINVNVKYERVFMTIDDLDYRILDISMKRIKWIK